MLSFCEYRLTADRLCLGERTRGGVFRPTARTIPYSQITGALRARFARDDLHACGHLVKGDDVNLLHYLIYAPRDEGRGISKIPLTVEFLANVVGQVFVASPSEPLPERIDLALGALRSVGFGQCSLTLAGDAPGEVGAGILNTRLPLRTLGEFGVTPRQAHYGYLFRPIDRETGEYELALFEFSEIEGPLFLREEA